LAKVTLYIACSLDGFIARPDGNLDWLNSFPNPDNIDHGYDELLKRTSCIIMGRKTYDVILGFGMGWPYPNHVTYVLSNDRAFKPETPETFILNGDIVSALDKIKLSSDKDIWLAGGGQVVTYFLNNDLIDEMIISVIPVILGDGLPLFPDRPKGSSWVLTGHIAYPTGIVSLIYLKGSPS
jgi:dihydrofolate reductase